MSKKISRDELEKAASRLGIGSIDMMRWVLKVAELNLSKISEGDWMNLGSELVAFNFFGGGYGTKGTVWVDETIKAPTRETLIAFHSLVRKILEEILNGSPVTFNMEKMTLLLFPVGKKTDEWHFVPWGKDVDAALTYNTANLLAIHAHRVRRCPECKILFLADRKNQSFCTLKHQNYSAVRKYRESKGLISGLPRGRPPKENNQSKKHSAKGEVKKHGKKTRKR